MRSMTAGDTVSPESLINVSVDIYAIEIYTP